MHIKRVILEGFKCYKDRLEPDEFSPKHNVIVGANGSGKSNFFAAIQFVLGDLAGGSLSAEGRKQLLHEGTGSHVMSAYVEVHFDNRDGRIPIEKDEVVLRRSIGLKKDEYFIDRKHVTKTEVASMLETAGFSRSNPYNIVPQGRVNELTVMQDERRLELLKDIAGTRTYDQRREESVSIMEETSNRRTKIVEMLAFIETRLAELDEEKEELARYQYLDKKRKVAEYAYYDKEQKKAKSELEKMDRRRSEGGERSAERSKKEEDAKAALKEAERKQQAAAAQLKLLQAELTTLGGEHKKLLKDCAKLEMATQQGASDEASRAESLSTVRRELGQLKQQAEAVERQLEQLAPARAEKAAEAERLAAEEERGKAQLQQLYSKQQRTQQFRSRGERDAHLQKEVKELKGTLQKKQKEMERLGSDIQRAQAKAGDGERDSAAMKQRLADHRAQAEAARTASAKLRVERDAAAEKRKQLWRSEQELVETHRSAAAELEKAQRTLQHSMSRSQWEAISAVRRIASEQKIKGVYGMLIELVHLEPKFFTAVEVAASNQLFQVVVDTDDTAARLLKELQRRNAGRVTFMPLNRLRPGADPAYPDSEDVLPMIKRTKFEEYLRPAFAQVFRKTLIVRNLDVGSRFSNSHDLNCVTLDGDQVNAKGALTGGYLDVRRSRLQAQADITRLSAQVQELVAQREAMQREIAEADQHVTHLLGCLQLEEMKAQKAAAAAELEAMDMPSSRLSGEHRANDAQKEKALAALRAAVQTDTERLDALKAELGSDFASALSAAEEGECSQLQSRLRGLQLERVASERALSKVEGQVSKLELELREHLQRREGELEAEIERLESEAQTQQGEGSEQQLEALQGTLATVNARQKAANSQRDELRAQERALSATMDELRSQLALERQQQLDEAKELDRLLSRKQLLVSKQEEFSDCIRKLGSLPKEAFDQAHTARPSKQLLAEIDKCHKELQQLGHVNKKALDQFANFTDQRDALQTRQGELNQAEASIKTLIDHLDLKKDEAIERTFKDTAKQFSKVFSELVPGGEGKLVMIRKRNLPMDDETSAAQRMADYKGVRIHVQFAGGGDTQTMEQLSGGQKTMVALCLIFAIQRCDPAPFYIFDEIDAALDATHRASLAQMIARQVSDEGIDEGEGGEARHNQTQFVTTTFRPELIHAADQWYGVTHRNKVSSIKTITEQEALRIISEDRNRQRQHAGVGA